MEGTGGGTVLSLRDSLHVKILARKHHLNIRKLRIVFVYRISYSSKHPVTKVHSLKNSLPTSGAFHGNLSLRRRHFGDIKSLLCKLLKEEVQLLYLFYVDVN